MGKVILHPTRLLIDTHTEKSLALIPAASERPGCASKTDEDSSYQDRLIVSGSNPVSETPRFLNF